MGSDLKSKDKDKIIVALDVDERGKAIELVELLKDDVGAFKVGMQLFNSVGPAIIHDIHSLGVEVFLDLKFHDIPNTVGQAARAVSNYNVFMFNVHASGGYKMMKAAADAARETAERFAVQRPLVIAVTVLTSIGQDVFEGEIGIPFPIASKVSDWAKLAKQAGLDGVVASPQEIEVIRSACGDDFLIVTPGVRPSWADANDQSRVMTPEAAIQKGADYLVIGRPITAAPDPIAAARRIIAEM